MIWVVHAQYSYFDDTYQPRLVAYFDGENAEENANAYCRACESASTLKAFAPLNRLDPGAMHFSRKERMRTSYDAYPCNKRNPVL